MCVGCHVLITSRSNVNNLSCFGYLFVPSYCSRRQEHTRTTGFFCGKLYCFLRREDPDPGKWCCLYSPQRGVSAPDVACQLLICCLPITPLLHPRWAVTRREFTLAPAYKACLLVRHSGGQRHLIMAIALGTYGSPQ